MGIKTLRLGGRDAAIAGDPADAYFEGAASHAAALRRLWALTRAQIPEDALVVDVGANIGLSTIILARAVPAGRVIAYEPSPKNAGFLRRNLAANAIANVEVVEAAASDRAGTLLFHEAPAFGAGSHVVGADHIHGSMGNVSVPCVRLDDRLSGERVAFAKIDCEGHEPEVVVGARRMLSRDAPLVFLEFNSWTLNAFAGHSPAAFADALWRNFSVERVADDGSLLPAPALALSFLHDNLIVDGCVSDLAIRPRGGLDALSLLDMTASPTVRSEMTGHAQEAAALRASTSWRLTAPLRALSRLLK